MIWLLDIPRYLEKWGLDYELIPGWKTRGTKDKNGKPQGFPGLPDIVIAHHTGGASQANSHGRDYPSLAAVRDGRGEPNPLPGPLSTCGLGFSGTVQVIAAGKCNHAGKGSWRGIDDSFRTIGVEAESPGDGAWTSEQREAYPLLCAAMLDMLDSTSEFLAAHREWALPPGRKNDPVGWYMPVMRQQVADLLKHGPARITPPVTTDYPQEEYMPLLENDGEEHWYVVRADQTAKAAVTDGVTLKAMQAQPDIYKTIGLSVRQLKSIPLVKA